MHSPRILKVLFQFFFTSFIRTFFFFRKPECPIDREDLGAEVGEQTTTKKTSSWRDTIPLVPQNDDDMSQT